MNKPTVSVVMITYGHENFIEDAINSVLMQQCNFSVELIVANDCSPDTTDDIIRNILREHKNSSWIKYIKHEKNIGMMPNFIFALKESQGDYIALCEGDDYWTDPFKLQKQVGFLKSNPDYVLCFHAIKIQFANGEIVDDFLTKIPDNYETIQTLALLGNYIHTPSVVFRNIIKIFPFEMKYTTIGDYFLYMILAEHGKLKYIDEIMGVYRFGVGVFSTSSELQRTKSNLKLFTCLVSYLENDEIKKIIFKRQLQAFSRLEKIIAKDYFYNYASRNSVSRAMRFIFPKFRQSSKNNKI
jgi:glycosyltransferase involved in cell wall biosynthesis